MTQLVQQNCQQMYTTMFNQLYNQLYVVLYDVLYNKLYNQLYIDLYRTDMGQLSNTDSEAEPSGLGHSSTDTDSCSSMPRKRHRSHMGDEQYSHLMSVFDTNPNQTPDQIQKLGSEINMEFKKVKRWFKNQRYLKKRKLPDYGQ